MDEPRRFWFPAKRYGWGWGVPIAWQGWVVLVAFVVLLGAGAIVFPPDRRTFEFVAYDLTLTAILIGIFYAKGEPPRWRWGD
ncbi:MAG TPA: hypothetical protein VGE52_16745 [Pirellulales bacterium]